MMEGIKRARRAERSLARVRIREIQFNPYQPRTAFDERAIEELAQSIQENGLISPVTVKRAGENGYVLIAGERRLRALKKLGRNWVDAIIMEADEAEMRVLSLIENIQREQLNFFEEARAMRELLRSTGATQEALSRKLGRNPSTIANRLRLLRLSEPVREVILSKGLTERHARALLRLEGEADRQLQLAECAAEKELNVRQLEALVDEAMKNTEKPKRQMKAFFRDQRMYVNAIRDAVKQICKSGAQAKMRVEETEGEIQVIVSLPKTEI